MIFGMTTKQWNEKNLKGWPWFAWRPVTLHNGQTAWLQKVYCYWIAHGGSGYWAYFEKPLKRYCEVA